MVSILKVWSLSLSVASIYLVTFRCPLPVRQLLVCSCVPLRSQGAAVKSRSGHFLFPVAAGAECRWIKASVFCEWDTGRRMCDLLGLVFGLDAGCYLRCNNTCVFHILDLIYAGNAFIQSIYRYICSAAVALPKPLEQRAGLLSTQCTVFHQNNTLTTLCYTGARVGG